MKTIIDYLDDLKGKNGSDYKTAKLMKTGQTTISNIRSRNQCGDETAIKIADLLGIDRNEVLIAAAIARSEGEVKKTWEKISKMSGIAATVLIACIATNNAGDLTESLTNNLAANNIHYAKSLTVTWDAKNSVSNFNIKCL